MSMKHTETSKSSIDRTVRDGDWDKISGIAGLHETRITDKKTGKSGYGYANTQEEADQIARDELRDKM